MSTHAGGHIDSPFSALEQLQAKQIENLTAEVEQLRAALERIAHEGHERTALSFQDAIGIAREALAVRG